MPSERLNYHPQRLKPSPFHGAAQAGAREGQETGSLLLELQQRIEDRRKAIELAKKLEDTWFIYYVMKIKTDCWCVMWVPSREELGREQCEHGQSCRATGRKRWAGLIPADGRGTMYQQ